MRDDPELLPPLRCEGETLVPNEWARGPWREDTQHGGPMIAMLARAIERLPAEAERQVVRLSVDLMRAAPLAPVEARARTLRAGRWVDTAEATLDAGGETFVRATGMRFAVQDIDPQAPPEARAERFDESWSTPRGWPFFGRVMEMRPGRGARGGMVWYRLRVPLVAGEEPSPLVRVAVASDFTYGTPMLLDARRNPDFEPDRHFTSINPDTTLNLHREARGEWVGLESELRHGPRGAATAVATVWDDDGPVGSVSQSILLRTTARRGVSWEKLRGRRSPQSG